MGDIYDNKVRLRDGTHRTLTDSEIKKLQLRDHLLFSACYCHTADIQKQETRKYPLPTSDE